MENKKDRQTFRNNTFSQNTVTMTYDCFDIALLYIKKKNNFHTN